MFKCKLKSFGPQHIELEGFLAKPGVSEVSPKFAFKLKSGCSYEIQLGDDP